MGELTALPQTPSWIYGAIVSKRRDIGREGKGRGRGRQGRENGKGRVREGRKGGDRTLCVSVNFP